ncbi:GNAT family N-acetyltransferase [Rhizobium sp. LjRoot254]|uniref:GNAT family N-acetyltransferase n=1 Tax=Rhizobium sp. LjRoot254 TaxID=3342297 RepID=UPI003ECE429D
MNPEIRQLSLVEVAELLLWAKAEGWNPGLDDAEPFHAADPAGFLGCFVNGRMAAGISAVTSGPDFGFIGLYICHPDFRGQRLGKRVWDAGIAHLGDRTIGLDGVPAQQDNYRSMGFMPVYRTWRYSGRFKPNSINPNTGPIDAATLSLVEDFDRRYYPGARKAFLTRWLDERRIARGVIRDGKLVGYGVLRKCHEGYKIGPLFSETEADASLIFIALCAESNGEIVSIDVPEGVGGFIAYLADIAFEKGFETARMYRGEFPRIDMRGVFGVTTLELG